MTYSFIGLADTIPRLPKPNYTKHTRDIARLNIKQLKVIINDDNKDRNHKGASQERNDTK